MAAYWPSFSFCLFIARDEVFFIVPSVEARCNGIFLLCPRPVPWHFVKSMSYRKRIRTSSRAPCPALSHGLVFAGYK